MKIKKTITKNQKTKKTQINRKIKKPRNSNKIKFIKGGAAAPREEANRFISLPFKPEYIEPPICRPRYQGTCTTCDACCKPYSIIEPAIKFNKNKKTYIKVDRYLDSTRTRCEECEKNKCPPPPPPLPLDYNNNPKLLIRQKPRSRSLLARIKKTIRNTKRRFSKKPKNNLEPEAINTQWVLPSYNLKDNNIVNIDFQGTQNMCSRYRDDMGIWKKRNDRECSGIDGCIWEDYRTSPYISIEPSGLCNPVLPEGWEKILDKKRYKYYYYHIDSYPSKITTWVRPIIPDEPWELQFDTLKKIPVYYNKDTKERVSEYANI